MTTIYSNESNSIRALTYYDGVSYYVKFINKSTIVSINHQDIDVLIQENAELYTNYLLTLSAFDRIIHTTNLMVSFINTLDIHDMFNSNMLEVDSPIGIYWEGREQESRSKYPFRDNSGAGVTIGN